jgi:hypothetical protein
MPAGLFFFVASLVVTDEGSSQKFLALFWPAEKFIVLPSLTEATVLYW